MSRNNFEERDEENVRAEKARIRQEMIQRRNSLSADDAIRRGGAILERLVTLPEYREARFLHAFVSMPGEVDTRTLIEKTLAFGKRVAVPVVRKGRRDLLHAEITSLSDLRQEGAWGLYQPHPERLQVVSPDEIGFVVVPGLAFDPAGNRVGFGAGYYDRFLARVSAPKVAVAFAFQVLPEVPATGQDVPVDLIVTEEGIYRCEEGRRQKDATADERR